MGSILIGIKRFFKNKNTVTIIAILAALGILYGAYYFRIKKATDPVSVPYATREIGPRTLITADMIGIKKVPGGIVKGGALINRYLELRAEKAFSCISLIPYSLVFVLCPVCAYVTSIILGIYSPLSSSFFRSSLSTFLIESTVGKSSGIVPPSSLIVSLTFFPTS